MRGETIVATNAFGMGIDRPAAAQELAEHHRSVERSRVEMKRRYAELTAGLSTAHACRHEPNRDATPPGG